MLGCQHACNDFFLREQLKDIIIEAGSDIAVCIIAMMMRVRVNIPRTFPTKSKIELALLTVDF